MKNNNPFAFPGHYSFNPFNLYPMHLNPKEQHFIKNTAPMVLIKTILLKELLD